MTANPKVQLLVRLPIDIHDKLDDFAQAKKITKTQVVITALEEFFQKNT